MALAAALAAAALVLSAPRSPAGDRGSPLQLYLRDSAYLTGKVALLGDVATLAGATEEERARLAACPLALPITRPTLLPVRLVREALAAAGAGTASVSGSRCVVLPGMGAREGLYFERLLRAIEPGLPRDARAEVELLASSGVLPQAAGPDVSFLAIDLGRVSGSVAGPGTLRVSSGGSEALAEVWVYTYLPAGSPALEGGAEVELSTARCGGAGGSGADRQTVQGETLIHAGDTVTIVFRKGGISVSSPGRALGSGSRMGRVSVRATDGGRTYLGTVLSSMEVSVEVP
jgi:hypothetical protein